MPSKLPAFAVSLARERGLNIVEAAALTIRRRRCGAGFSYCGPHGRRIIDRAELARLAALAVPPAYSDVRYAVDPSAHLQAIGTDAAGRLQYRYHPQWDEVREAMKGRRLVRLVKALPVIRRSISRRLNRPDFSAEFAICVILRLVDRSAIRAGSESYAQEHGTRGASTLLKSNVRVLKGRIHLNFRGKGGKVIEKEVKDPVLARAIARLMTLPGRRLFQYQDDNGQTHPVSAGHVNTHMRGIAGRPISLKDFRTLVASANAVEHLTTLPADVAEREKRAQLKRVMTQVADTLANTPAVCRKSYVHSAVVAAFEEGRLSRLVKVSRSTAASTKAVARLAARGLRA